MMYSAPLDDVLRVREPSATVRILQHSRQLEIAREQGNISEAIHQLNMMLRIYWEMHAAQVQQSVLSGESREAISSSERL